MKKTIPILLLIITSGFMPFLYASAVYNDGYDNYANTTVNPFLWHTTVSSTSCFTTHAVSSVRSYLSPPNTYSFTVTPTGGFCVGTTTFANVSIAYNASNVFSVVKVFFDFQNVGNNTDLATNTISAYTCITTVQTLPCHLTSPSNTADFETCAHVVSNYCVLSTSFATTPGTKYYLMFEVYFAATWSQTAANVCPNGCFINFDNASISGGNAIVPGANFFMTNSSSTQWFSIQSFLGSRIILNYTSTATNDSNQWAPQGVTVPDINYTNLGSGKLITVYVGNIYSRSLIPSAKTYMILDNPASVVAYTISVIGLPNQYGPLSKIFIQQGGKNITSGYLDSAAKFAASLIPGNYVVIVTSQDGSNTQIQTLNFPATASALTFNAYSSIIAKNGAGVVSAITWSAGWNGTAPPFPKGIVVNYVDTLNSTCGVNDIGITIKRTNGSGAFNVFSSYFSTSGCAGNFSVTIPANSNNMNYTLSNQLSVYLNATNFFGTHFPLGSQGLSCFNCLLLSNPNLPTDTLGLGILPGITWLNLIAFGILTFTAGAFGIYWSRFGFFVTAAEVAFFVFAGWLSLTSTIATAETIAIVFILLAFTGLMTFHERT